MKTTRSKANPLTARTPLVVLVPSPAALSATAADADIALGGVITRAIKDGAISGGAQRSTMPDCKRVRQW